MKHYIENSRILFKDRIFYHYKGEDVTFSEFYYQVCNKSISFSKLELHGKSILGILLSNPIDIIEIYFACLQLDIQPVCFPGDISKSEFQKIISKYNISFIISEWTRKEFIKEIDNIDYMYVQELSQTYGGCDSVDFPSEIENVQNTQSYHLTSGTTGIPKMVELSFHNFINSVDAWNKAIQLKNKDIYIQCLPLNHIAGMSILIRSQCLGFKMIIFDKFNVKSVNEEIENGATLVSLLPSMLRRLIDLRRGKKFPVHFRGVILGGDSCSSALLMRCLKHNIPVFKTYGMTETCSGVSGFWINEFPEHIESVGKSFSSVTIDIKGKSVRVEGPMVMKGYHGESGTKNIFTSNDNGYKKRGFLYITGRNDDIIKINGKKVSLSEIHNILLSHRAIDDVLIMQENNEMKGNRLIAYLELNDHSITIDKIKIFCSKFLSDFKMPEEFHVVDEIGRLQ